MSTPDLAAPAPSPTRWITRTVLGIVLATFFSDFSHEMATAMLPLYLTSIGLGPAALGVIEGIADFLVSISKLAGGAVGHHLQEKKPITTFGYLVTSLATAGLGLANNVAGLVSLRGLAWIARGFRGPLRDHMLADAVEPAYFGRAYGLERTGDMLGAVAGPLVAALILWVGIPARSILIWTLLPGIAAAGAMFFLTRERKSDPRPSEVTASGAKPAFPAKFWLFLVGVLLFGLGDFSRTFLIWLAAGGTKGIHAGGTVTAAVLLYAMHNLVAATAAYPVGHLGDRTSKMRVLVLGYALGVGTNLLLAFSGQSYAGLVVAIVLSGVYISVEQTLEKATAATLLPRELRSLGFGILASANAVGDMVSSLGVGVLLQRHQQQLAFGLAAAAGLAGVLWMVVVLGREMRAPKI